MIATDRNDWGRSAKLWHIVAPPLSPSPEDGEIMLALAAPVLEKLASKTSILVLGVTPAIIGLDWPEKSHLVAVDGDETMITNVWRPNSHISSSVLLSDWASMPFDDDSFDLVVGDCSLNALPSAELYRAVTNEIARLLRPEGSLILRCFMPPSTFLSAEEVVAGAAAGHYASVRDFRYAFALASKAEDHSVWLPDLLPLFDNLVPDRADFAKRTGWDREDVDRGDIVFNQPIRLTYPPLEIFEDWIAPSFVCDAIRNGSYFSAPLCPTLRIKHA